MTTPEPLTIERLYELCEYAKTGPAYWVTVNREELWALVDMAKERNEAFERAAMAAKKSILEEEDQTPLEYIAEGAVMAIRSLANGGGHTPVATDENGNARTFGE